MKNKPTPTTQDFDREFRAQVAQMTSGLAPTAFTSAWADWAMHMALSPAKRTNCSRMRWCAPTTPGPSRCAR